MDRITRTDLDHAFAGLKRAAEHVGHDTTTWRLRPATYGNGYRLYALDPESGGHGSTGLDDFLGMTGRDAYNTLRAYASALWSVPRP